MPILKVKNKETGQWEQVGVSTEATGAQIAAHNVATDAHPDIRQAVTNAGSALSAHNAATDAHADIRQAISQLAAASAAVIEAQTSATQFVVRKTDLQSGVSALADNTLYLVYE